MLTHPTLFESPNTKKQNLKDNTTRNNTMASQDDTAGLSTIQGNNYPNYEDEEATFTKFLQEHTILIRPPRKTSKNRVHGVDLDDSDDDDDDDDDVLLEPTFDGSSKVQRVACYPPLLQRIKNRHYFDDSQSAFVIEIPLSELVEWDAVRGSDLAQRAKQNTLRYHDLFCKVIDDALEQLPVGGGEEANNNNNNNNNNNQLRDTVDILQEQRLAQQAVRDNVNNNNNNNDGGTNNVNGMLGGTGGGGLDNDPAAAQNNAQQPGGATEAFPPSLMRRYELRILPFGRRGSQHPFCTQQLSSKSSQYPSPTNTEMSADGVSLRYIRSRSMGRLVTIRGMIVRASDVKPSCVVATYTCDSCGAEIYQVIENKREFMPQRSCPSQDCQQQGGSVETLHLQTRGSKFVKFQELKLQELPSQVPMGHVPRSMSLYCRGELTRLASPGDVVTVDGVFLPQRIAESGYRAMKAGLISTTYLEAQNIVVHKKSYDESLSENLSEEETKKLNNDIMKVATGEDPIGALSASIAPEIFGHEDIKRSLLLQLVGGCTRKLPDGMRIRGDINICLMGDPGVAKSQLLKHVASIAPRGVYTTGKGSSGVGLTAAVTKDLATGEMSLEGGALVLADRGICAIDEFDKMDEADRTAIHEVMEQQTVSIAKAGIVATLNARAAVLAAANPLYSRYNRTKSLSENVNLPNSLLSRFDLMFLILDTADVDRDMALARHVTFVHQNEGLTGGDKKNKNKGNGNSKTMKPNLVEDYDDDDLLDEDAENNNLEDEDSKSQVVTSKILREYISRARRHQPVVPPDVAPYIVEAYVSLRMQDRPGNRAGPSKAGDQTVMTARQLLSILRLGQALARLRFSDFVAREDVDEAIRLTHMSKASLTDNQDDDAGLLGSSAGKNMKKKRRGEDVMSRIFNIIRDYGTSSRSREIELQLCEAMVLRKGFTAQQLQSCLEEYESLDVIQVNSTRTHVYFL